MRALLGTSSFLDRLRGTGPLAPARAREHGALGPIGKASGFADDARLTRPYDGYAVLAPGGRPPGDPPHGGLAQPPIPPGGDALARLKVRDEEITQAFGLIRLALSDFPRTYQRLPASPASPETAGRSAGPKPRRARCSTSEDRRGRTRVPAALGVVPQPGAVHEAFAGDILTDFAFIEASFGLSAAGAAL